MSKQPKHAIQTDWLEPTCRRNAIVEAVNMTKTEKAVMLEISHYMYQGNLAWPSLATIARRTSMHRTTVNRCIKALEDKGYLRRKSSRDGVNSNRYEIDWEALVGAGTRGTVLLVPEDEDAAVDLILNTCTTSRLLTEGEKTLSSRARE